jgi:hypothetical protein
MYELRQAGNWNLLSISVMFLFSLSICFICTTAAPQSLGEGTFDTFDMDTFYWRQRKAYFWSWIVCQIFAIVANFLLANSPLASRLAAENLINLAVPTNHFGAFGTKALGAVGRRSRALRRERDLPRVV